jgi:hypothetical protein
MSSLASRALVVSTLLAAPALAAPTDMFTPALYAKPAQFLECRIVNVSGVPQDVSVEAHTSTGAIGGGPSLQTLAPGEAGGFSISGAYANLYCKFTVNAKPASFRVSIDVLAVDALGDTQIILALPGF